MKLFTGKIHVPHPYSRPAKSFSVVVKVGSEYEATEFDTCRETLCRCLVSYLKVKDLSDGLKLVALLYNPESEIEAAVKNLNFIERSIGAKRSTIEKIEMTPAFHTMCDTYNVKPYLLTVRSTYVFKTTQALSAYILIFRTLLGRKEVLESDKDLDDLNRTLLTTASFFADTPLKFLIKFIKQSNKVLCGHTFEEYANGSAIKISASLMGVFTLFYDTHLWQCIGKCLSPSEINKLRETVKDFYAANKKPREEY